MYLQLRPHSVRVTWHYRWLCRQIRRFLQIGHAFAVTSAWWFPVLLEIHMRRAMIKLQESGTVENRSLSIDNYQLVTTSITGRIDWLLSCIFCFADGLSEFCRPICPCTRLKTSLSLRSSLNVETSCLYGQMWSVYMSLWCATKVMQIIAY